MHSTFHSFRSMKLYSLEIVCLLFIVRDDDASLYSIVELRNDGMAKGEMATKYYTRGTDFDNDSQVNNVFPFKTIL